MPLVCCPAFPQFMKPPRCVPRNRKLRRVSHLAILSQREQARKLICLTRQLISDDRVAEWSRRILEAMRQHLEETLVDDAAQIPEPLLTNLKARRAHLIAEAKDDAKEKAKQAHYKELQRLQDEAVEDVSLSGAEYDPERPSQDLIAGISTKLNLFDSEKEPSRPVVSISV